MAISKEYKRLLDEAVSKKSRIKQFFNMVKRENSRYVTRLFHELHEEVFREIDCLNCANCCSTISPLITDRDVQKMAGALRMKPSDVAAEFLTIDEDKDYVYKSLPCPFLDNKNNECSIYNSRPKACREYPHTNHPDMRQILTITFKNTFICPAVYLIVKRMENKLPLSG